MLYGFKCWALVTILEYGVNVVDMIILINVDVSSNYGG